MANYALLEWPENLDISDDAPDVYVSEIARRFGEDDWRAMQKHHALPEGWATMRYEEFLDARRQLMAGVIRLGYEQLL